jgi:ABC-type dipeptide/oligopeptide/nickel transport system permease subunit
VGQYAAKRAAVCLHAAALVVFPGAAVTLVVLAYNFLGDGLRDALDPRL